MKRFLLTSIIAVLSAISAFACISESTHNYYLFSVFPREMMNDVFSSRINEFWKSYSGNKEEDYSYKWNRSEIMKVAEQKGDHEMIAYMNLLNDYLDISQDMAETWGYPSKEDLAKRKKTTLEMLDATKAYRGTRLRPQYYLLQMRANMLLKRYADNVTFWVTTGSHLPESIYRDMMRNIYANALLHTGSKKAACEIYAEQGDMLSLKWCVRKYRNLAGIRSVYQENPNSHTLRYLVQDFVNNAQETIDTKGVNNEMDEEFLKDRMMQIGACTIYQEEVMDFIRFANQVIAEGKNQYPCMWKTAIGTLNYFFNNEKQAIKDLDEAMTLAGTDRMKDNARAIRLVVSTKCNKLDSKDYRKWLLGEMKWLDQKIKEERGNNDFYGNHYTEVKDRLIFKNLAPKAHNEGQMPLSIALVGMLNEEPIAFDTYNPRSPRFKNEGWTWNEDYRGELFDLINTKIAINVRNYYNFLTSKPQDDFYAYVINSNYKDADYFNDLIGTKYLAEGNFAEAEYYLQKVNVNFLNKQNISAYMAKRNFEKERWFGKQSMRGNDYEGPNKVTLSNNPKLTFARKMKNLNSEYNLATGEKRRQLAYQLASAYYQASYQGDCWYLTHYGYSCGDTARIGEKDYVAAAVKLLEESNRSSDPNLHAKSLYALAFIPLEPWADVDEEWDNNTNKFITIYHPNPKAKQYQYLSQLDKLLKTKHTTVDGYASRCDVLKVFRKETRG